MKVLGRKKLTDTAWNWEYAYNTEEAGLFSVRVSFEEEGKYVFRFSRTLSSEDCHSVIDIEIPQGLEITSVHGAGTSRVTVHTRKKTTLMVMEESFGKGTLHKKREDGHMQVSGQDDQ
jgi:hypothetical protein